MTDRETLEWVYELSRKALFERTYRSASREALSALSKINKELARFKHGEGSSSTTTAPQ